MKTASHNGQTCYFSEKDHRYFVGDQVLLSATQFKAGFFPKFEKEKVAAKYGKKHGMPIGEVLAMWEEAGRIGRDKGNAIHEYAESQFVLPGTVDVPECWSALKDSTDLAIARLNERYKFFAAEMIVFSTGLGVAGQIDLLMTDGPDVLIWDWKTNRKIEQSNPWRNALAPIDHLMDCNFEEYAVQLSIYKYIMQREKYFPEDTKYRMGLCHLTENGPKWFRIPDMKDEIIKMIEWV